MVLRKRLKIIENSLFYLLVLLLPTQLAYHFWPAFSFVNGIRVDYLSPAIYLTDILLVFLVPFIVIQVRNIAVTKTAGIVCALFIFLLANIYFSVEAMPSILKWLTLGKISILAFYVSLKKQAEIMKLAQTGLYLSVLYFCLIGISQFILNKTVGGIFYYFGERSFTVSTPGIALVSLFGKDFIRPYSTFSHPNSMAGFLVVSVLLILYLNTKNKLLGTKGVAVLLSVSAITFILVFSFSAYIGLVFLLIFLFVQKKYTFIYRKLLPIILISAVVVSFLTPALLRGYKNLGLSDRVTSRIDLAGVSLTILSKNPVTGVGLNNFIKEASRIRHLNKDASLQPVHNIFLLTASESGMIGLLLICLFLLRAFEKSRNNYLSLGLIFILVTGLFDHYWLTLQQNLLLFSFYLGVVFNKDNSVKLK